MTFNSPARHVLIVEDEPLLAYALEELVIDAGFLIAGVTAKLEMALAIIESGVCDAAIIDANLNGVSSAPAGVALTAREIPFIVLSGYSRDQQQGAFAGALYLQKPCRPERLIQTLRSILPTQSIS